MDILTSGCSFTSQMHPHNGGELWQRPKFPDTMPTWSDYLYKRGHNTINLGVPTNSNTNIVRSLIYHSQEMLKQDKEFSIIAQFSGPTRHQIFVSKKETTNWIEFLPGELGGNGKEFDWNLTNFKRNDFTKHFWLLTGENYGREYSNRFNKHLCGLWGKYLFSVEEQQLNTLERMYDLQEHCVLNNIPFKIFCMDRNYFDIEYYKKDIRLEYMVDLIDWSNVWLYKKNIHGGMTEWMENEISDPDVRYYKNPTNKHPSNYAHEKFVDDIILKWEMFKDA